MRRLIMSRLIWIYAVCKIYYYRLWQWKSENAKRNIFNTNSLSLRSRVKGCCIESLLEQILAFRPLFRRGFVCRGANRKSQKGPFLVFFFFFFFFFLDLGFTALSRIFHLYRADRSSKVGENRRTRGKPTWPSVSRTWLSHVTRASLEPQRWEA